MALSGSSTVMLKCEDRIGMTPWITSRRYALKALVESLKPRWKSTLMNQFASRLTTSLWRGEDPHHPFPLVGQSHNTPQLDLHLWCEGNHPLRRARAAP